MSNDAPLALPLRSALVSALFLLLGSMATSAQSGQVVGTQDLQPAGGGGGSAIASAGDVDGNGVHDVVVGNLLGGVEQRGVVTLFFMNGDGSIASQVLIDPTVHGISLGVRAHFGAAVAGPGDVDGDGVDDLVVGGNLDGANDHGAIWTLFLEADGGVKGFSKQGAGSTVLGLQAGERFGSSLAVLGDLDDDGVTDLGVGSPLNGAEGAVRVLFMNADGTVDSVLRIDNAALGGALTGREFFGIGLDAAGDVNGDGELDLAVGSLGTDSRGELWLVFLDAGGVALGTASVAADEIESSLTGVDIFGWSVAGVGDVDGDGTPDVAVSAPTGHIPDPGRIYLLYLDATASVRDIDSYLSPVGTFSNNFGQGIGAGGDWNGDGNVDLLAADLHDGAWALFLSGCPAPAATPRNGSGLNPLTLFNVAGPTLGATWDLAIDASGHAPGVFLIYVANQPTSGIFLSIGELLFQPAGGVPLVGAGSHGGGVANHSFPVPDLPALCGREATAQVLILGSPGPRLGNALDVVLGR